MNAQVIQIVGMSAQVILSLLAGVHPDGLTIHGCQWLLSIYILAWVPGLVVVVNAAVLALQTNLFEEP